jgi:hypothetical protein
MPIPLRAAEVALPFLGPLCSGRHKNAAASVVSYRLTREAAMPRKRSLTSTLYRAARASNNARAARKGGPVALAERLARRQTYSKSMGMTGRLLRLFGLK